MHRIFPMSRILASKVPKKISYLRVLCLAFLLALGIGSAGWNLNVQASSQYQQSVHWSTKHVLQVKWPKAPICVGREYRVYVEAVKLSGGSQNGENISVEETLEGINIMAMSENQSIATISPDRQETGAPELASTGGVDPFDAEFTISAVKAGNTSVQVETTFSTSSNPVALVQAINVVNCKYKVTTVTYLYFGAHFQGIGIDSYLVEHSSGEMQLVSGSDNTLKGSSKVDWHMESVSPFCGHSHKIPPSTVDLDGTTDENGQLTLHITYHPFEMDTTNCASGSIGQFSVPEFDVTVPADGGTQTKDHSFKIGDEPMQGYTTVIITPVGAP